jgi:DNA repair exonuclease SbcCD nuclease subunit
MKFPYLLYSDVHFHDWDSFSVTMPSGMNSRLAIILDELDRAYAELQAAGGQYAICAGDLFHVRGKVNTSVLVPVIEFFNKWKVGGITTIAISGNHDLESNDTTTYGSMVYALYSSGVYSSSDKWWSVAGTSIIMVSWHSNVVDLKKTLDDLSNSTPTVDKEKTDLIIHAPVDEVIIGIPSHGLDAAYLASLGFKRVFSGHYHNHVDFKNNVWSIGATTHQTWGDVGSKAGYLIVDEKEVNWRSSHAPKFVDANKIPESEMLEAVDGNYVRFTVEDATQEEIGIVRKELRDLGAKGIIINAVTTKSLISGTRVSTANLGSLDKSISEYAEKHYGVDVAKAALEIFNNARCGAIE